MRHGRRDRPEAHPAHDAELPREFDDRPGERAPAVVRLRAREDEEVVVVEADGADRELGPPEFVEAAVDDAEGRPPRAVVEQCIRVERGDDPTVRSDVAECSSRRRTGIDPPVERPYETWGDEIAGVGQ